jgi:hypothetical protein
MPDIILLNLSLFSGWLFYLALANIEMTLKQTDDVLRAGDQSLPRVDKQI